MDDGFEQGMAIPFYYDPMIAKLICHAENREAAIEKMIRAIGEYDITGLETTLGFCRFVMEHPAFRSGDFDTRFVENYFKPAVLQGEASGQEEMLAAVLATTLFNGNGGSNATAEPAAVASTSSKWRKNRA